MIPERTIQAPEILRALQADLGLVGELPLELLEGIRLVYNVESEGSIERKIVAEVGGTPLAIGEDGTITVNIANLPEEDRNPTFVDGIDTKQLSYNPVGSTSSLKVVDSGFVFSDDVWVIPSACYVDIFGEIVSKIETPTSGQVETGLGMYLEIAPSDGGTPNVSYPLVIARYQQRQTASAGRELVTSPTIKADGQAGEYFRIQDSHGPPPIFLEAQTNASIVVYVRWQQASPITLGNMQIGLAQLNA